MTQGLRQHIKDLLHANLKAHACTDDEFEGKTKGELAMMYAKKIDCESTDDVRREDDE